MDAITTPPAPINEPNLTYAPGSPERAELKAELARLEGKQHTFRAHINGKKRNGGGAEIKVVQPHDHQHVLGTLEELDDQGRRGRDQGREGRCPGLAGAGLRREVRDHPQGRRPARRSVAPADQRRHDARPVEDGLPGRDRLGVRADRLLALQRPLRQADPHRPADRQQPRHLEPHRPPPARGLRLRDHAVQLHRHRRQPADRAGADGQHRHLEAVADPAARRVADDGAARGGRHAARRHQHAPRRRPRRLQGRADAPRPRRASTSPAPRRPSTGCGRPSARTSTATAPTRASSARPVARTSSSPTRPPTPTSCGSR